MLIAIPKERDMICPHFGHCEEFALYDTEKNQWNFIKNPEHVPGMLPGFLKKQGVQVVIAGGMGGRAQELFELEGIQTLVGAKGDFKEVMDSFLKGQLKSTGEVCSEHAHAGECHG